jgi:hypothetical protein
VVRTTARTTTRPTTTSVTTTVNPQLVVASSTTIVQSASAVISAPTTSIDKVINSSAGANVRSAVRWLEVIAAATAVFTLLYWWHTWPRRRVKLAERKAQQQTELTQEAREVYAAAVAGAGASVFADEEHSGELVPANAGASDAPPTGAVARENLPLAARLPRAMTSAFQPTPADLATGEVPAVRQRRGNRSKPRPNPRPAPRRHRTSGRTDGTAAAESTVDNPTVDNPTVDNAD